MILGVIAVAVLAVFAYTVIRSLGSDEAVELESDVRAVLDGRYDRASFPTWCVGGCSASDDEWHALDDAEAVAREVVEALRDAGFVADFSAGAPDAYLVSIADGSGLDIGVTGPEWAQASAQATGTAIWFTSVTVFDQQQTEA